MSKKNEFSEDRKHIDMIECVILAGLLANPNLVSRDDLKNFEDDENIEKLNEIKYLAERMSQWVHG